MHNQTTSESAERSLEATHTQPVDPVAVSPMEEFLGIGLLLALLLFS